VPANTLPIPIDSAHLGDVAESPTPASTVRVSVPASACVIPAPSVRLRACVESDWPTSAPSDTLVVQLGATNYYVDGAGATTDDLDNDFQRAWYFTGVGYIAAMRGEFDRARDKPLDSARGRPLDRARGEPLDCARG